MTETILTTSFDDAKKNITFLCNKNNLTLGGPWEVTGKAIAWSLDDWLIIIWAMDDDHCELEFYPFRDRPMGENVKSCYSFINKKLKDCGWYSGDIKLPDPMMDDDLLIKNAELPDRMEWEKEEHVRLKNMYLLVGGDLNGLEREIELKWKQKVDWALLCQKDLSNRQKLQEKTPQEAAEQYFGKLGYSLNDPTEARTEQQATPKPRSTGRPKGSIDPITSLVIDLIRKRKPRDEVKNIYLNEKRKIGRYPADPDGAFNKTWERAMEKVET